MDQLVPQLRSLIKKRDAEERIRQLQSEHTARLLYDLHNPIAGLKQSIGYLVKGMAGPVGDHQKELLGYMTNSIDKVIGLLNDMMDLTKLEGGRVRLNKGIANIADGVNRVTGEFRVPFQSNKITLDVHCDTDLPPIEFDSQKIEQVVQNFLSNAVKYTPQQGAVVVQVKPVAMVMEEGQQPMDGRALCFVREDGWPSRSKTAVRGFPPKNCRLFSTAIGTWWRGGTERKQRAWGW